MGVAPMNGTDLGALLTEYSLFADCSAEELSDLVTHGSTRDFQKGQDMIGDFRTDALHEALQRAPIEDDTLISLDNGGEQRFKKGAFKAYMDAQRKAFGVVVNNGQTLANTEIGAAKNVFAAARASFDKARGDGMRKVANNPQAYVPNGRDQIVSAYKDYAVSVPFVRAIVAQLVQGLGCEFINKKHSRNYPKMLVDIIARFLFGRGGFDRQDNSASLFEEVGSFILCQPIKLCLCKRRPVEVIRVF